MVDTLSMKLKDVKSAVITIDGPSASGKTVLCQRLTRRMDQWEWLSTGVFYRGLAYMISQEGIHSPQDWARLLHEEKWEIQKETTQTSFWYNGQNVTELIYNSNMDQLASKVAASPSVREALIPHQKKQKNPSYGLLAEGRDCGTVIFSEAPLKIFLTAMDEIRAERRAKDRNENVDHVISAQKKRDQFDSERVMNPLRYEKGMWIIHTDKYSLEEVEEMVYEKAQKYFY